MEEFKESREISEPILDWRASNSPPCHSIKRTDRSRNERVGISNEVCYQDSASVFSLK